MAVQMIFPNYAVADIARATAFYEALGFAKNPVFSDETTSCVVVNDQAAIMLLEHAKFDEFLTGDQQRAPQGTLENLLAVLLGSNEEVDAFASAGASAGGTLSKPVEANEWGMYGGQLTDPDGHIIDFFFMEAPQG
ncbi:VOC family protein [Agrococcus sp. ARC_14]|uniref:VOC family protein n=1 Tax=Agrococcus sp. ARC_14 TaxID=2919927 RepID=UPI001F069140|nr:VOC family protein [Agrococcus sp. ARC_14]MCH1882572.1 lactoylglutathione lyase [Agrococcus sp. ARC_14]